MTIFINDTINFSKYSSEDYKIPQTAYVKLKAVKDYPKITYSKFMNKEIKITTFS